MLLKLLTIPEHIPMDVNSILDAPIAHGHNKRPIILLSNPRGKSEPDVGKHVVIKDGVDGLGVVVGSVLEAVDLVDILVGGRCVVCHRCCLFPLLVPWEWLVEGGVDMLCCCWEDWRKERGNS